MIYAQEGEQSTRNVPTSLAERSAYVLTDGEILKLARSACAIERHYGCPMDIEWAKDGRSGELFVVQARPEKDKADALEAELKPLVGGSIVAKMFKYDTDPAHNPQPPRQT